MANLEAFGVLPVNEGEVEMTRENTSLYTHLGQLAVYDHLFTTFPVDGEIGGAYLWSHHPQFKELAKLALEHGCIGHINLQEVNPTDQDSYVRHATVDLGDTIPEAWLGE